MAYVDSLGYVRTGEKREHVVVAEKAFGGKLPAGVEVHHFDQDGANNDRHNLVICNDKGYHKLLHVRERIVAAGGDPNVDSWCTRCGIAKHRGCFTPLARTANGLTPVCKDCHNRRQREQRRLFGRNDRPNSRIRMSLRPSDSVSINDLRGEEEY